MLFTMAATIGGVAGLTGGAITFSILLAILFSLIALLMAFDLREETSWTVQRRLGSAIVMGVAVSAMHYTGMAAASFIPSSPANLSHAVRIDGRKKLGVLVQKAAGPVPVSAY
jgi:NO-binding membrane sensor protein with MHYT domain